MKNIGIVTICDNDNYGNRLQNYALQEVLKKLGFVSETLINYPYSNTKEKYILRRIRNLKSNDGYSSNLNRAKNFKKFNKYIKFSSKRVTPYSLDNKYDFYVVGSDQVWNPTVNRLRDVDLLSFVRPNKRISYAASFGISDVKFDESICNELNKFKNISVRENIGKDIVKKIFDRDDVEVVLDPTMLLSTLEWEHVIKEPRNDIPKKYILSYFLGDNEEYINQIEKIALIKKFEIINILDERSPFFECGPSEFLYLEKHAELICTDSFHSSVFAVMFNTPLVVFERKKSVSTMNSRIDTLIESFGLTGVKFNNEINDDNLKPFEPEVYKRLDMQKEKSVNFLIKSLIKDGE